MPDDRKKPSDAEKNGDDGFTVDVPDDLLEEAVSAVDRRVAQSKNQVNTGDEDEMPAEFSVGGLLFSCCSGVSRPGFFS